MWGETSGEEKRSEGFGEKGFQHKIIQWFIVYDLPLL